MNSGSFDDHCKTESRATNEVPPPAFTIFLSPRNIQLSWATVRTVGWDKGGFSAGDARDTTWATEHTDLTAVKQRRGEETTEPLHAPQGYGFVEIKTTRQNQVP